MKKEDPEVGPDDGRVLGVDDEDVPRDDGEGEEGEHLEHDDVLGQVVDAAQDRMERSQEIAGKSYWLKKNHRAHFLLRHEATCILEVMPSIG